MSALLEVRKLTVHYPTRKGVVHAADELSFHIAEGETLGLVGESGCGKSSTAKAILPKTALTARAPACNRMAVRSKSSPATAAPPSAARAPCR